MTGEFLTGNTRKRYQPFYSSVAVATTTVMATTIRFFQDVVGANSVNFETTNMVRAGQLPADCEYQLAAVRCILHGGAADMTSFVKQYMIRIKVAGVTLLEATPDLLPGGAGVNTAASNGIGDVRAIATFDENPILIKDTQNIVVEAVGTTFTTTAAFFMRLAFEGVLEEPC